MKRFPAITISAFVTALAPILASAADYTFKIPLQIQNLHEQATDVRVRCELWGKGPDGSRAKFGVAVSPKVPVDRQTGNVSATEVQVTFDVNRQSFDPRDATSCACELSVVTASGGDNWLADSGGIRVHVPGGMRMVPAADTTKPYRDHVGVQLP